MRVYIPIYYEKFKCIADRCKHNCCIGWDVEIDKETYNQYLLKNGNLGEKIRRNIYVEDEIPYFKMKNDGKCPFLNQCSLCDIICECTEKEIPYICRMHPRFKNVFSERTEYGLGLCCEEAARIIISEERLFGLMLSESGDENLSGFEIELLETRQKIFDIFNDNSDIESKIIKVLDMFSIPHNIFSDINVFDIYDELEYMDSKLVENTKIIRSLWEKTVLSEHLPSKFERAVSNIACYFVFRMVSPAESYNELRARVAVALLSLKYTVSSLRNELESKDGDPIEKLIEIARLYSSEIEYSPDNMEILIGEFDLLLNFQPIHH